MNNFINDLKNTNFFYFYKLLFDNYLKLFFFITIGLLIGYSLYINTEKQIIIYKKIYPVNTSFNIFRDVLSSEVIFNDFIRLHREKVSKKEYEKLFEISSDSIFTDKSYGIYKKKIITNLVYDEYLKLSEGYNYLKEKIDYEFDIYHISKSITYLPGEKDLESRINDLKNNFDEYLKINNQIVRHKIFKILFNNPAFYKKILTSFNSDLILVDQEYLMEEIFKKNAREIEKITRILNELIDLKTGNFIDQKTLKKNITSSNMSENLKKLNVYNYKNNANYTFDEIKNFAGLELDRIFKDYFPLSVNGIDGDFQIKIVKKSIFFYLAICSILSVALLIFFLIIRDFVRISR